MQDFEKSNSIVHFAALAGLWLVNILIVIFTMPFLIYKTIRDIFTKSSKHSPSQIKPKQESSRFFPCRID